MSTSRCLHTRETYSVFATHHRDSIALRDEFDKNSSHRVVPYTHDALITDQTAAQTSIHAIA
jgi:hypothetical protein